MACKKFIKGLLVLLILTIFPHSRAEASVQLTVSPAGSAVFVLQGKDLEEIAVLDLEFSYDPAVMINPQGLRGALIPPDAIFNFNASVAGQIRLFIRIGSKAVNGSGTLATLSFEPTGDTPGAIQSFTAHLISAKATPVVAAVQILSQARQPAVTAATAAPEPVEPVEKSFTASADLSPVTSAATAGISNTTGGVVTAGSVSVPVEPAETDPLELFEVAEKVQYDEEEPRSVQSPLPDARPINIDPSTAKSAGLKSVVYQSVLERMRTFAGERNPAALTGLFKPAADQRFLQEPSVVVSDGESVVTVRVDLPQTLNGTPAFSFRNASMVALEPAAGGSWMIEVLPKTGVMDARISVEFDGSTMVCPLAVAPPIDPFLLTMDGSGEAAFARFLKRGEGVREPRFDLNGDGRFDYMDDYIFAAHVLVSRQKSGGNGSGKE